MVPHEKSLIFNCEMLNKNPIAPLAKCSAWETVQLSGHHRLRIQFPGHLLGVQLWAQCLSFLIIASTSQCFCGLIANDYRDNRTVWTVVNKHFACISSFKTLSHTYCCCSHWTNDVNNMFEATWLESGKIGVYIQVGWLQCSPSSSPPLLFCLSNKALALPLPLPSFLSFSSRWAQLSSC